MFILRAFFPSLTEADLRWLTDCEKPIFFPTVARKFPKKLEINVPILSILIITKHGPYTRFTKWKRKVIYMLSSRSRSNANFTGSLLYTHELIYKMNTWGQEKRLQSSIDLRNLQSIQYFVGKESAELWQMREKVISQWKKDILWNFWTWHSELCWTPRVDFDNFKEYKSSQLAL